MVPVWENGLAPPSVKVSSHAGVRNQDARVQPKPEAQDVAEPDFLAEGQEIRSSPLFLKTSIRFKNVGSSAFLRTLCVDC